MNPAVRTIWLGRWLLPIAAGISAALAFPPFNVSQMGWSVSCHSCLRWRIVGGAKRFDAVTSLDWSSLR